MPPRTRSCLATVTCLLVAGVLHAQMPALSRQAHAQLRQQESLRAQQAEQHLASRLSELNLGEGVRMRRAAVHTDELGMVHTRFQPTVSGVKVWGAQVITHQTLSGTFQQETVSAAPVREVSLTPTLQDGEALAIATKELAAKGTFAVPPQAELVLYPQMGHVETRLWSQPGEELNALEYQRFVGGHVLAYHVHTELENAVDGMRHRDYIVHAHTGEILKAWDSLQKLAPPPAPGPVKGIGKSAFNGVDGDPGDVTIDTYYNGTVYELRDVTRPTKAHPITGQAGNRVWNKDTNALYTDTDNTWGDGANYAGTTTGPEVMGDNGQTAAVDGAFGTAATWDFYKNIFNRNGIDNQGSAVLTRVHATSASDNANWNLSCFCMTYGDVSSGAQKGRAMTALDIAGHEISHGVNSYSAALIYSDESGGLNEANSDILGKMVEIYARAAGGTGTTIPDIASAATTPAGTHGVTWTVGAQLGSPMRVFYKPSLDGVSVDAWSWSMGATKDVHYTSGPANRMFYFLSVGAVKGSTTYGSKLLPNGMTGIGADKAARIWYRALTTYFGPMTNYAEARLGCILAATDLYGAGSAEVVAVHNAFAGINVGIASDTPDLVPPVVSNVTVTGTSGVITLNAAMTDNTSVLQWEPWIDGLRYQSAAAGTMPADYPLLSTGLSNGTHSLVLKAYDQHGNVTASAPVSFTVANDTQQLLVDRSYEGGDYVNFGQMNYEGSGWSKTRYLQGHYYYAQTGDFSMIPSGWAANFYFQVNYNHPTSDNLFVIPENTPGATLSFSVLQRGTNAKGTALYEVLLLDSSWNALAYMDVFNDPALANRYVQYSMPIPESAKGKKVRLVHWVEHTGGYDGSGNPLYTLFNIDDVALTVPTSLKAPANGSWTAADVAKLAAGLGKTALSASWDASMDLNKDGRIDENDVAIAFQVK